jgi:glycosyltransferase involved in cell wall biosynthesis
MEEKLLVIARAFPRFDQNSGDLRFFSLLKVLSPLYEITYWKPNGFEEPDGKYISSLRAVGIKVTSGDDYPFLDLLRNNKFSAAILEFYFMAEKYLPRIRLLQPKCPIIIDSVDVNYYRAFAKYGVTRNPEDLKKAEETKWREIEAYEKADAVITVTDEDAEVLRRDCTHIRTRLIPNIHLISLSDDIPDRNALIFVGGFSHDPNIDAVLYFCREILPRIRKVMPTIKFTIVGSDPPAEIKALGEDVTGYVPSTTPYLHHSYVSVAPLRYGAGMKGKIGEAMAHGRPVVTTSIGAQGMGLTNRKNVIIADSPEGFAESVVELIRNEELYKTIQVNAVEHVRMYYSEEQVEKQIHNVMSELRHCRVRRMLFSEKVFFFSKYARDLVRRSFLNS